MLAFTENSVFNFCESSFHQWPGLLTQFRHQEKICSPIYWGAHEQIRGNWDFNRSPFLGLEKFLSLLHEKGLRTEILFGFFPSAETFPEWTGSLSQKSIIAECLWDPESPAYSVREVPSLDNPDFLEGFYEFANELFSQISLYRAPGGPVENILMDLTVYSRE